MKISHEDLDPYLWQARALSYAAQYLFDDALPDFRRRFPGKIPAHLLSAVRRLNHAASDSVDLFAEFSDPYSDDGPEEVTLETQTCRHCHDTGFITRNKPHRVCPQCG